MSDSLLKQKISLKRIAHVYYTHKDIKAARQFLLDFGFSVVKESDSQIYFRGYGTEPFVYCTTKGEEDGFGGTGWVVDSLEDLERATALPGATPVHDSDAPGGGKRVTFFDPVDNFPSHLVYGQESVEITETFPELVYNFPTNKHRPVNQYQRFKKGPAPIHKLGHVGVCSTNFKKSFEFWTSNFNLKPTELVYAPDSKEDIMAFMHLDRGEEWVDHHAFFVFEGPKYHVHHSSFEIFDFDIQMLGHTWLMDKGYEICWGVGRHVMGSQIFDYWFDPSKFILEHYIDGDLVNDKTPVNRTEAAPDNLHVWGPDVPETYLT
ncbi:Glyoxalase/Bleomycin resistance protein/Dihydroxybiphenyl dioxygenase [Bisporella sp. PMI_857]|nr:Glyoxalase/Bleomycin resistance protein/Dihydroxybiphenyl dioxygenase [Bisporella sp. PMI_857]